MTDSCTAQTSTTSTTQWPEKEGEWVKGLMVGALTVGPWAVTGLVGQWAEQQAPDIFGLSLGIWRIAAVDGAGAVRQGWHSCLTKAV